MNTSAGGRADRHLAQIVHLNVLRSELPEIDARDHTSVRHQKQTIPEQKAEGALPALGGDDLFQGVLDRLQARQRADLAHNRHRIG